MFLEIYRLYNTRINTEKVTDIFLSKDLKSVYFKYLYGEASDKVDIDQFIGIRNASAIHRNSHLTKVFLYYPLIFKHDFKKDMNPRQREAIEKMQSKFESTHGDRAKKIIE